MDAKRALQRSEQLWSARAEIGVSVLERNLQQVVQAFGYMNVETRVDLARGGERVRWTAEPR
jgi:hypothetical protein